MHPRRVLPLISLIVAPLWSANLTPAWVELGPTGAVARIVMDKDSACPQLKLDGKPAAMTMRIDNPSLAFPVRVCEASIASTVKAAAMDLGGKPQSLALPVSNPRKIVVIGDTGCRIKIAVTAAGAVADVQDCQDTDHWPFRALATAAAEEKPDLVIHVGDYLYRESPCPDPAKCGAVSGYTWPVWNADFFLPAAELLQAAPWIFIRGNHEDCDRAWQGFFYLMDPRGLNQMSACASPFTDPYVVKLGKMQFAVMDSALANDITAVPRQVAAYTSQFQKIQQKDEKMWLLTHRPVWGFMSSTMPPSPLNATLEAAWNNAGVKNIDLVIAGHIHLFELLSFQKPSGLPPQLVVGTSGAHLHRALPPDMSGTKLANHTVAVGETFDGFSYGLMTAQGTDWRLQMRNAKKADKADCTLQLKAATVSCR